MDTIINKLINNGIKINPEYRYFKSGSQSDIYIVNFNDKNCLLKLYRNNIFTKNSYLMEVSTLEDIGNLGPKLLYNSIENIDDIEFYFIIIEYLVNYIPLNEYTITINQYEIIDKISNNLFKNIILLHNNGIIHKDIKLDNILINDNYDIKFIDLGLGYNINKTPKIYINNNSLAFYYQCPDLIIRRLIDSNDNLENNISISKINDIYSCIFLLAALLEPNYKCFKIQGIIPEYFKELKNVSNFMNNQELGTDYYKILKDYLVKNVILLQNKSEFHNKINNLIKMIITNIDNDYNTIINKLNLK